MKSFAVVGSGFSGAVLAHELARHLDCRIVVFEERNHVAGNSFTRRDEKTGIMLHEYGPHIFNTSRLDVWDFVRQFDDFGPYINRVKAKTARGLFSLPINLMTINQFFGKFLSPTEARAFVATLGDSTIREPQNFEEQALKFLGRELYEAFFYGYTKKQWGCEPTELPASILQRLPVRFNYDDNYYASLYQGIPRHGYTHIVEKLLASPRIEVRLGQKYDRAANTEFDHVFYTGPLDAYFQFKLGRLRYRTVYWDRIDAEGDFQGNAVINYTEASVPHTRISEHKHFAPWEQHVGTAAFVEFSKATGPDDIPYYPLRLEADKALFETYRQRAEEEPNVSFLGRLATYRYLDMDKVVAESLDFSKRYLEALTAGTPLPKFPAQAT
jgi:UDP-galactopyranose mutase